LGYGEANPLGEKGGDQVTRGDGRKGVFAAEIIRNKTSNEKGVRSREQELRGG